MKIFILIMISVVAFLFTMETLFPTPRIPPDVSLDYSLNGDVEKIEVTISGEVESPGKYEIEKGVMLGQLLTVVKVKESADFNCFNIYYIILNKRSFYIPPKSQTLKVSLSAATTEQLQTLPGIGTTYANRIIEYRQSNQFETIEDITNISGIGESIFTKIKDLICL